MGCVSCAKCGVKHHGGSQASIDPVKGCIKGGAQAVLVVGDKTIKITNAAKVHESLCGLKVTKKGTLNSGAVEIACIAPDKVNTASRTGGSPIVS
jgi:hypothetical protein